MKLGLLLPDGLLIGVKHWGPISSVDAFYKTNGKHNLRRTDYSESYNTFGLEWSERYLFTYINSRLLVSGLPWCYILLS
jgi:hypothetical protein